MKGGAKMPGAEVMIRNQKAFKKFVRYDEGADLYSMSKSTFQKLAKEAGAIYKYHKVVLVNTEKVDDYLELFQLDDSSC
jgi:hypothetical protein